jgi:hypothetical protein
MVSTDELPTRILRILLLLKSITTILSISPSEQTPQIVFCEALHDNTTYWYELHVEHGMQANPVALKLPSGQVVHTPDEFDCPAGQTVCPLVMGHKSRSAQATTMGLSSILARRSVLFA